MSCDELQDQFVSYLLGELSADEAHSVEAHLASSCSSCQAELEALREALELVFTAAPVAHVSRTQLHRITEQAITEQAITEQALRKSAPSYRRKLSPSSAHPETWVANPGEHLTVRIVQALLAVAAGFFLMVGWQALTSTQLPSILSQQPSSKSEFRPDQSAAGLSGDADLLPGSNEHVHYVSLKMRPALAAVHGYYLEDAFSGQAHVVGNINRAPLNNEQFRLIVVTDLGETEVPVAVGKTGRFMKLLTTSKSEVREIMLQASTNGNR